MVMLVIAALLWFGVHVGISGTRLRDVVVARIGEAIPRPVLAALDRRVCFWSVHGESCGPQPLWYAPEWLRWVLVAVMLVAFVLFVASVSQRNPTMVGAAGDTATPPRGIHRVTRHPMLWSFALWAAVHIIGTGDRARSCSSAPSW